MVERVMGTRPVGALRPRRSREWAPKYQNLLTILPFVIDPSFFGDIDDLQAFICQRQLTFNTIPLVACDCGVDGGTDCYRQAIPQSAAHTFYCASVAKSFWPSVANGQPSFGFNSTDAPVALPNTTNACSGVTSGVAEQSLFSHSDPDVVLIGRPFVSASLS